MRGDYTPASAHLARSAGAGGKSQRMRNRKSARSISERSPQGGLSFRLVSDVRYWPKADIHALLMLTTVCRILIASISTQLFVFRHLLWGEYGDRRQMVL